MSAAPALRAEWVKFWTVRSTRWTLASLFVLGAGLTVLVCATSADDIADGGTGASPATFLTWGVLAAQLAAIALGALAVTGEYGTGMVRATLAAVPRRGRVVAAKGVVLAAVLFVAGTVTAVVGYLGGNWFLDRAGAGVALTDDGVLRAVLGNGLYLAGLGLLGLGLGFVVRHTGVALTIGLTLVLVVGNLAYALPGAWGDWVAKLLPGNAGAAVAQVSTFSPTTLAPWTGFAVFAAETAVVVLTGLVLLRRRDA